MMEDKRETTGNKDSPRHDYMSHRTKGSMTNVRMTSTRTVGNEAGNGQGFENYHTGDGATYFKVEGKEYSPIYGIWNWRMIPGTTVVVDDKQMPRPMWGKGGEGGNSFAGVVSDQSEGVAAFIFEKDEMNARKAWFCLDQCVVALGCDINSDRSDAPIVTTINQTHRKGEIFIDSNLSTQNIGSAKQKVWHNQIGYYLLQPAQVEVVTGKSQPIFLMTLHHGTAPKSQSYGYIVAPNINKEAFDVWESPIEIITNTKEAQAIVNRRKGKIMAIFYEAGTINIDKKSTLTSDKPAVVIVNA